MSKNSQAILVIIISCISIIISLWVIFHERFYAWLERRRARHLEFTMGWRFVSPWWEKEGTPPNGCFNTGGNMKKQEIVEWLDKLNTREKGVALKVLTDWKNAQEDTQLRDLALKLLHLVNRVGGNRYRPVSANLGPITTRLKEYGFKDCVRVILVKKQDPYFIANPKYFNPQTLFRAGNFERYVNEDMPAILRGPTGPPDSDVVGNQEIKVT